MSLVIHHSHVDHIRHFLTVFSGIQNRKLPDTENISIHFFYRLYAVMNFAHNVMVYPSWYNYLYINTETTKRL